MNLKYVAVLKKGYAENYIAIRKMVREEISDYKKDVEKLPILEEARKKNLAINLALLKSLPQSEKQELEKSKLFLKRNGAFFESDDFLMFYSQWRIDRNKFLFLLYTIEFLKLFQTAYQSRSSRHPELAGKFVAFGSLLNLLGTNGLAIKGSVGNIVTTVFKFTPNQIKSMLPSLELVLQREKSNEAFNEFLGIFSNLNAEDDPVLPWNFSEAMQVFQVGYANTGEKLTTFKSFYVATISSKTNAPLRTLVALLKKNPHLSFRELAEVYPKMYQSITDAGGEAHILDSLIKNAFDRPIRSVRDLERIAMRLKRFVRFFGIFRVFGSQAVESIYESMRDYLRDNRQPA